MKKYRLPKSTLKEIALADWSEFASSIRDLTANSKFIFRGQECAGWNLKPSVSRVMPFRENDFTLREHHLTQLLDNFRQSSRGRRGANPAQLTDNEWWALGQHHGLVTPLLDWSRSPYVALFFAMSKEQPKPDECHRCAVYALNTHNLQFANNELPVEDQIDLVDPDNDENPRLIAQRGLFTRHPVGKDLEEWVKDHGDPITVSLFKITIPNHDRSACLNELNSMNINHATLFPDLYGAGKHSTALFRRWAGEDDLTD